MIAATTPGPAMPPNGGSSPTSATARHSLARRPGSGLLRVGRGLLASPGGIAGTAIVVVLVLSAVLAPVLAPSQPLTMNLPARFEAPSLQHWFGTDEFGRDLLSRVMYGGRVSLVVGVSAVALGGTLGTVLGMVAGYYGRWVDQLVMRSMDTLYAFPAVLLAIGIIGALGPGEENLIIAVAVTSVPIFARIGRASVLEVRDLDYVAMGPLLGGGSLATLRRHVFPNAIGPVIVVASLQVASAILSASALSYLGLGIQPPTPEWGSMLADAQTYITSAPWLSIFPGLAVMAAVMGFNLLGDALRDVLDPRMAKR